MRQIAIRIADVVLFVFCCWLAAGIGLDVLSEAMASPTDEVERYRPPVVATTAGQPWETRQPILDRNLFGAKLAGVQAVVEIDQSEIDLEETKLPLKLLGTIAGETAEVSSAAILDESTRKHQVVFVGNTLRNHARVEVVGIDRMRVVLQNGPKREELRLHEDQPVAKAANIGARPKPKPRRRPRSRNSARNSPRDEPKLVQQMETIQQRTGGRSPANLFSQARIVPKYDNGAMVGIQLNDIESGSLYEKIGLSDGDVITSLNDIKIDNASASAKILTEFTEAEAFTVTLEGGGTIEVTPEDLPVLLQE